MGGSEEIDEYMVLFPKLLNRQFLQRKVIKEITRDQLVIGIYNAYSNYIMDLTIRSEILSTINKKLLLLFKVYKINCKKKKKLLMDIKNRKHAEIFDYSFLSKPIEFIFNKEYNHSYDNLLYGNNIAIKAALKNNYPKDLLIEHGYYFGDYVPLKTLMYKNVVTFSEKRVESINNFLQKNGYKKKKITVITVGPYINYAEGLMTERQKAELKKNFGKILIL